MYFPSLLSAMLSAPSAEQDRLRFLAIGDWGGTGGYPYYTEGQWATAQGLASVAAANASAAENLTAASFVLSLGDNFYPNGIRTDHFDNRFEATFENVYSHQELQVPWYVLVGNHDYRGNITAQLEYSKNPHTRWEYPDYNYRVVKEFAVNNGGPSVKLEIIMIDTNQLNHGLGEQDTADDDVDHPGFDQAEITLNWIESALQASDADYLLVAGHHPIYSPCSHGSTSTLVTYLDPLLKQHDVALYLSGHEHCQFHFEHEEINYVTTGTGHSCCYAAPNWHKLPRGGDLKYVLADSGHFSGSSGVQGGFVSLDVGRDNMTVAIHSDDGTCLYEDVILPKWAKRVKTNREEVFVDI